jgi:hypothetical protein
MSALDIVLVMFIGIVALILYAIVSFNDSIDGKSLDIS